MSDAQEPVGGVGEEAAKLFEALRDWTRENGSRYAGAAAGAGAGWEAFTDHVGGSEDCRYCPVCRAIAMVRRTPPEVKEHLSSAASSLVQAVAAAMATHPPNDAEPRVE